jgi:hypothetical protein
MVVFVCVVLVLIWGKKYEVDWFWLYCGYKLILKSVENDTKWSSLVTSNFSIVGDSISVIWVEPSIFYTPAQQSCKGGILESACPSCRLASVGFFLSAQ